MRIDPATKQRLLAKIKFLVEFGDENDLLRWAKVWNPAITKDQEKYLVKLFRDVKRDRGRS
jgi:hypothetical protein